MSANIFWPSPDLYVSNDPVVSTRCFISGLPQELSQRPVLREPVTAFSDFPVENSWVNQLAGADAPGFPGTCVPPSLNYRCAIDKICQHNSLLTGDLQPSNAQTDNIVMDYPQVNQCTQPVYYRQTLDQRRNIQVSQNPQSPQYAPSRCGSC